MSSYIASNDNRLYASAEAALGRVPAITGANRLPAVRFTAKQTLETAIRRDKTGTRTFAGTPTGTRRKTEWNLKTYLTAWTSQTEQPGYGPLFSAAMGRSPQIHDGGTIASAPTATQLAFQTAHGLTLDQAVCVGGELRFVSAVIDSLTVEVNAPFSMLPAGGTQSTPTITYKLGKSLPTASIFDYWSPTSAIQRALCGAAVDTLAIKVNADFHEFEFSGPARDLIDGGTFEVGQGELAAFPDEPAADSFELSIVPGHLGQVWLGFSSDRFYTLTAADLTLNNAIETRSKEFGIDGMREVTAGQREVSLDFELFASDDEQTSALYSASRQRSPMPVMIQLGQQERQLFGVYLKSVVPEVPEFDDSETRLLWKFKGCRAQGSGEDEIVVAFA